jgi:hypothetical protein
LKGVVKIKNTGTTFESMNEEKLANCVGNVVYNLMVNNGKFFKKGSEGGRNNQQGNSPSYNNNNNGNFQQNANRRAGNRPNPDNSMSNQNQNNQGYNNPNQYLNPREDQPGQNANYQGRNNQNIGNQNKAPVCYGCFELGHYQRECRNKRKCKHCKGDDHAAADCPTISQKYGLEPMVAMRSLEIRDKRGSYIACTNNMLVKVYLDGIRTEALLDTGSDISAVSAEHFANIRHKIDLNKYDPKYRIGASSIQGEPVSCTGLLSNMIIAVDGTKILTSLPIMKVDHV